jgi:nucleoside-diphosphate-sugar epimerase
MNILLLGATGFVGSATLKILLKINNVNITCTTRKNQDNNSSINWVKVDLLNDNEKLKKLLLKSDIVINCVGEVKLEKLMNNMNYQLVSKIVDLLLTKINHTHFIQLSSVGCYGAIQKYDKKVVITEDSPENPLNTYEVSKTLADNYIRGNISNKTANVSFTIVRPTNIFGEEMKSDVLRNLSQMVKKNLFFFIGNKKSISNYVHVDDVAELIFLCIECDNKSKNRVFIVSDDLPQVRMISLFQNYYQVKRLDYCIPKAFVEMASSIVSIFFSNFPLSRSAIDSLTSRVEFSNNRARKTLNFYPKHSMNKTIEKILYCWDSK